MTTALAASSPDWEPPLACPPRWGTPRTADRPTLGPRVGEVASLLGLPLMPWQQHVLNVALELDPFGLPVYREVGLTVPRQQGKTLLVLCLMVHRAVGFGPPHGQRQNILYAAQTGTAAGTKLRDDHLPLLDASPLRKLYRPRMVIGSESIRWTNRSRITVTPPTEKAGHGETLDLGIIDEAFAHADDRLEQAFKPAMLTRRNAQLWWLSTAGKAESVYLLGKVEAGRALAGAGVNEGVAYFEWSADPDADPADPATWRSCMPALCPTPGECRCSPHWRHTVTEGAIRADQRSMKANEFRRGYLNIADTERSEEWQVVGREAWQAAADKTSRVTDPVAFAVDVSPDSASASIAVAGRRGDGLRHVEVVDHRPGARWVVDRMVELAARWRPCAVVVDPGGYARPLVAPLEAAGLELVKPNVRDAMAACVGFHDAVAGTNEADRNLRHIDQPELAAALAGARKRPLGGAWAWTRSGLSVDISPLVAATYALWGHATRAHLTEDPPFFAAAWR